MALTMALLKPNQKAGLRIFLAPLCIIGLILIYGLYAKTAFLPVYFFPPLFSLFLWAVLLSQKNKKERYLNAQLEDIQGKINIAGQQLEMEEARNKAMRFKLKRYDSLALLTEKFNRNLSLDDALHTLSEAAFQLFKPDRGVCLIYLCDDYSKEPSLSVSLVSLADKKTIIPKRADVYDQWVLKHTQPLLIEDTSSDFRFDPGKFKGPAERKIGSIISCCLVSHGRPLGIIRLDSPRPRAFGQDELRLLSTIADIGSVAVDNAKYYQRVKELAITDSLTGLYTRKYILERLDEELKRAAAQDTELSLLMIDIDFFKKYNDRYGHLAGDIVLKGLSAWLKDCLKDYSSVIGRLGGEEFLVVLPLATKEAAFTAGENIRGFVQEKRITLRRKLTGITISGGISSFPGDARLPEELLNKADTALYEAKRMGRNRVCLF